MRAIEAGDIDGRIRIIRGQRGILDRDLADLYGVKVKAINQTWRRNRERFPEGFAFTDYGVAMLSSVLKSRRAIDINIRIIQAFVRLRRLVALEGDLRMIVTALQAKVGEHDESIRELFDVLGEMGDGELRPILGFQPTE